MLLNLEKYFILESRIKATDDFSLGKQKKVDYEVEAAGKLYANNDDSNQFRVILSVTFGRKKGSRKNSIPYTGYLRIAGFIGLDQDVPKDRKESLLMVNGLSLLYSAAREHIAMVTGRGPWDTFYLPVVSFRKDESAIDDKIKKKIPDLLYDGE